jgi:hypothetical protein
LAWGFWKENQMNKIMIAGLSCLFASSVAVAAAVDCEAQAVSKDGKPLAGAAKSASIKKCERENKSANCEALAVDKNGKALAGAAKNSFMKKCEAEK